MDGKIDRRAFLAATASLTAAIWQPHWSDPKAPRTRLILLGTGGGPRPRRESSGSAQVIIAGDRLYVVDCGDGVARQLVLAGASLATLRHVFITHHHSDHNADYGNLLLLSWEAGLQQRVDTWGTLPSGRSWQANSSEQERGGRRLCSQDTHIATEIAAVPTEASAKGLRQCLNFDLDVSQ